MQNWLKDLTLALSGQYAIEREIGRGGMGVVFLARDERLDRQVALKVLPPELARHESARERFLREARMAAKLSHPNIVPVYRADEIGGFAFFAMEYIAGDTLAARMRARGVLNADEVIRVARDVAWALAYAHARGIIHRDIKPENILIEANTGRALVTDFGIARTEAASSLTADGNILGTVHYMSPEQAQGSELDGRSDLYMLGCVAFVALSGHFPFDAANAQGVLVAIATRNAPPLGEVAPHVPATLALVIDRSLSRDRELRFGSCEEFAAALGKAAETAAGAAEDSAYRSTFISGDEAMAVWQRAAELQAVTASQQEEAKATDRPASGEAALPPGATGAKQHESLRSGESGRTQSAATGSIARLASAEAPVLAPTDSYSLRDVEDAALEAGISRKYVALALAELKDAKQNAADSAIEPVGVKAQLAALMLDRERPRITVTRKMPYHPRTVLLATGRTLRSDPYRMELLGTTGGEPLAGGTIVFSIPEQSYDDYRFMMTRYMVAAKELHVRISPMPDEPGSSEITAEVDLRRGRNANFVGYSIYAAALAGGTGALAAVAAGKLALVAAALTGLPILGGIAAGGALGVWSSRVFYRGSVNKARKELEKLLTSVEASLRSYDLFGELPAVELLPRKRRDM